MQEEPPRIRPLTAIESREVETRWIRPIRRNLRLEGGGTIICTARAYIFKEWALMLPILLYALFPWFSIAQTPSAATKQKAQTIIQAPHSRPIRVGGNFQEPIYIHKVYPAFPEQAKKQHIEGQVLLHLVINEEGLVYQISGEPRNNRVLEKAAMAAVKQWKYQPFLLNGERIPAIINERLDFAWKDREDIRIWVDASGLSCDLKRILEARGAVWIELSAAPYPLIEDLYVKLRTMGEQRVHWPRPYHLYRGQLFYSMGMRLETIGAGPLRFNKSDIDRLHQLAEVSGKFGRNAAPRLSYKLYFDRAQRFMELKRLEGPEIPAVERALEQIHPLFFPPDPNETPVDITFDLNFDEK
jgi:TonB family protein